MGNSQRGIHICYHFDTSCFTVKYLCKNLNDIIGLKDANKIKKDQMNGIFRVMSRFQESNSERDFPQRALRFSWTDGVRITATERRGKCIVILLVLETKDGCLVVEKHLRKLPGRIT